MYALRVVNASRANDKYLPTVTSDVGNSDSACDNRRVAREYNDRSNRIHEVRRAWNTDGGQWTAERHPPEANEVFSQTDERGLVKAERGQLQVPQPQSGGDQDNAGRGREFDALSRESGRLGGQTRGTT